MFETIRIDTDPRGVATLWLARPDKHNALSQAMMEELTEAAATLGADPAVRVVVLAGEGASFCAGGDLGWMQDQMAADAETRGRELLGKVGLADKAEAYPDRLSGGQQQRVAIARALAMDPDVLLFDEPTSALDPELAAEVVAVLSDLAAEHRTLVVVTHSLAFARRVADRVVFLEDGRILQDGSPEEFFSSANERLRRFREVISSV